MNIIPVGKSNSFKSELSDWKDAFVTQYAKHIVDEVPYLEVDANMIEDLRELDNTPQNDKAKLTKEEAEKRSDERTRSEHFRESLDDRLKQYVEASCGMSHKKEKDSNPVRPIDTNTLYNNLSDKDKEKLKNTKFKHLQKKEKDSKVACDAGCGCDHGSDNEEVIIKKKKNKPLKNVIKEGDPPMEKDSSFISINEIKKQLEEKIASLDTKLSMMDEETRDKLIAFWADDLGLPIEYAEALVKSYY